MPNPEALALVQAAVSLSRTHPHAPLLDVLDVVMKGRVDQVLDFADPATVNGSLAAPGAPFGRLLVAAFDEAMTPNEWAAFTATTAEAALTDACLDIWRTHARRSFGSLSKHLAISPARTPIIMAMRSRRSPLICVSA